MNPIKLPPAVCQIIYVVSVISAVLIPVLVTATWLDPEVGKSVDTAITALASIAGGGAGLAAVRVGRQMSAGTFAVPGGTSAEQLATAARNYVADEAKRQSALTDALQALPGGGAIAIAIRDAISSTPTELVGNHGPEIAIGDAPAPLAGITVGCGGGR